MGVMFMRRLCIYGIITLFLILTPGFHVLAQEGTGPVLVLNEKIYDFGEVKQGKVIEHTFRVLNQGDEVLQIIRVKSS
jgi:Protein of unknown function (DUF1573)